MASLTLFKQRKDQFPRCGVLCRNSCRWTPAILRAVLSPLTARDSLTTFVRRNNIGLARVFATTPCSVLAMPGRSLRRPLNSGEKEKPIAFSWQVARFFQQFRTAGSPDDLDHSGDVPRPVGAARLAPTSAFLASKLAERPPLVEEVG